MDFSCAIWIYFIIGFPLERLLAVDCGGCVFVKMYAGVVAIISLWPIHLGLLDCLFGWDFCSLSPIL